MAPQRLAAAAEAISGGVWPCCLPARAASGRLPKSLRAVWRLRPPRLPTGGGLASPARYGPPRLKHLHRSGSGSGPGSSSSTDWPWDAPAWVGRLCNRQARRAVPSHGVTDRAWGRAVRAGADALQVRRNAMRIAVEDALAPDRSAHPRVTEPRRATRLGDPAQHKFAARPCRRARQHPRHNCRSPSPSSCRCGSSPARNRQCRPGACLW